MKDLIEKNKAKVSKHRHLYETGKAEFAVRTQLIEPILNELGWLTSEPDFVIPNLRTTEKDEPDYTLKMNDEIVAYIEAKKISSNLKDHIGQLARYCYNQGVDYGILTDGMKWILFKAPFEKGKKINERIIWEIDFEKNSVEESTARLNTISFENFPNLKELSDRLDNLDKAWENIFKNPAKLKPSIIEIIISDLKQIGYDSDTTDIENYVSGKLAEQTKLFSNENVIVSDKQYDFSLIKEKASPPKTKDKKLWDYEVYFNRIKNPNSLTSKIYQFIKKHRTVSREQLEKYLTTECEKSNGEFYSLGGATIRTIEALEHYVYIKRDDWQSGKWNSVKCLK